MKIMKAKDIDYGINISVRLKTRLRYMDMDYANVHIPYVVFCQEKADHPYSWG